MTPTRGLPRRPTVLEQRDRVLDVAAVVLGEKGFERGRLRDVAEAAGVSIGTLQNYFETRDAMFEEAFSRMCEQLVERWRGGVASHKNPWDRLVDLLDELMTSTDAGAHSVTVTEFCASASRHPQLRRHVASVYENWRQILRDAIVDGAATGDFRPSMSPEDVADVINALLGGFEMEIAVGGGILVPQRFRDLALEVAARLVGKEAS